MNRSQVTAAAAVAAGLGIPLLVLQRWVATTRFGAMALVAIWIVLFGVGLFVYLRRHPELRLAAGGTFAAIVISAGAIGYWTGFRDKTVDEDVVVATAKAAPQEREASLGGTAADPVPAPAKPAKPAAPVEIAAGTFSGKDGHAGSGTATVVKQPGGGRVVTFTNFDVDPGVDVDVYLTPGDGSNVDDRVELGNLKGNVGDQQYEIPADADLGKYSTVTLWCKPFTVRIATAPLA